MTEPRDLSTPKPANTLSTALEAPAARELALFVEAGLMVPETQRVLAIATQNLSMLKNVATPVGARHFNAIDNRLGVRAMTPVSRARDCLSSLGSTWEGLRGDFHRFREMYLQVRVARAELTKNRKLAEACTDVDDRAILEAKCDLEAARIESLEAQVAHGQAALKTQIDTATSQAASYAVILKDAGKESFTEADFKAEEITYYLKSAFWHASLVFRATDNRSKWTRLEEDRQVDPDASAPEQRAAEWHNRKNARENRAVSLQTDAMLYFEGLGFTPAEVKAELEGLLRQREGFELMNSDSFGKSYGQSFAPRFEAWLDQMAAKYKTRAAAAVEKYGPDRLKRIASMIAPTLDDAGNRKGGVAMDRESVTE